MQSASMSPPSPLIYRWVQIYLGEMTSAQLIEAHTAALAAIHLKETSQNFVPTFEFQSPEVCGKFTFADYGLQKLRRATALTLASLR